MTRAIVPVAIAVVALTVAGLAAAQPVSPSSPPFPEWFAFSVGGAPGVHFFLNGADGAGAQSLRSAIAVDPSAPLRLSVSIAPPANTTWDVRSLRMTVLVAGPDRAGIVDERVTNATAPPGDTIYLNETIDLARARSLGTGTFLVRTSVVATDGRDLASQTFYVHLVGNVLASVGGAVVALATVAAGYGLLQLLRDLKEIHEARERHKREEEAATESRLAKGLEAAKTALTLTEGATGLVAAAGDRDAGAARLSRSTPVKWTLTGLGLGGVAVSWAQFLGYLPVDVSQTLLTMAALGAVFLVIGLVALATVQRARSKRRAAPPAAPPPRTLG
ncbi:MAG: hypothetical protein ACYDCK_10270 [Thermoplasmatota archaeon]